MEINIRYFADNLELARALAATAVELAIKNLLPGTEVPRVAAP